MTTTRLPKSLPLAALALFWLASFCLGGFWLAGCANHHGPTTRPMSASERSDKAMKDPFGYSPDFSDTESDDGIVKVDRKGLKRDLDNVFNP